MYILNIVRAMKKMFVNEIRGFIFENYYKRIVFCKESSYYSMKRLKRKDLLLLAHKLIEKVPGPHNANEHLLMNNANEQKISETIRNNYLSTKKF